MSVPSFASSSARGTVVRIAGPVVGVIGLPNVRLFDVVRVGRAGLIGEVIRLDRETTTVQVYEDTSGLCIGEPVLGTGVPLVAKLGPGLLGTVYDGLQRPLSSLAAAEGAFLERGLAAAPLPEAKRWAFTPTVQVGQKVEPGDIMGLVPENQVLEHRVLVPPSVCGRVSTILEGDFTINDTVALVTADNNEERALTLHHAWPVRRPRPVRQKLTPNHPLITGTRIIDTFFPIARGGSAIIPGGFGTGKTVTEQSLARWADADVVVYVGCGERGNEMAEVLEEFPHLEDPRHGLPLMLRTILIANTSNMPVAAREASIYTGITIAEYYRDMGYEVLLLADSTSRWGEALREISGRLQEMPGEESYPAYLGARLSEFYERSGRVVCLGTTENDDQATGNGADVAAFPPRHVSSSVPRIGSVTIVGAVSPPGGDFSEPITQNSLRVVGTFWALDYDLSRRRHFPAINWTQSYSLYYLSQWFAAAVALDWPELVREAQALLQEEVELTEIVQLVGPDALAIEQKEVLEVGRLLREDFLQQSAVHEVDRFCSPAKAYHMLRVILAFHHRAVTVLKAGTTLTSMMAQPVVADIARMKEIPVEEAPDKLKALEVQVEAMFVLTRS